jgi:hypothetical protein
MRSRLLQNFPQPRVVDRQQGSILELPDEGREPDATQSENCCPVQPVEVNRRAVERRFYGPEQVKETDHEKRRRQTGQNRHSTFYSARQQQQERQEKVKHDQKSRDPSPAAFSPMGYQEISSVRLPDQMIRNCENDM